MPNLEPTQIADFTNGLITEGVVADSQFPINAVTESVNFHFDKIGGATLRKGVTALGDALSGDILGLYEFRDSGAGANNQIVAVNGTVLYYLSGSTWTSKRTSLTAASKSRFTTFLDFLFMVNGTEATAIWTGAAGDSFLTTGNAASAPTGKYIETFRNRVWIAGNSTYPDRIYYSTLPSSVTTPVITWDTSVTDGNWIDISPSDGDNITGLFRDINSLVVFKKNHIYRVYNVNETEPDPKFNVGTYSQESVVNTKAGIFFHHPTGIYLYAGGQVQYISQPVNDFLKNVTLVNYSKVNGWEDGDHVYHSIGDVTIGDITYTNVTTRYTISTRVWTVYSHPTQFLVSSDYNDATTLFRLVGDDGGNILKTDVGVTDNTTPIFYSFVTKPITLDGLFSSRKNVTKMALIHEGGQGSTFTVRADSSVNWQTLSQIDSKVPKSFTVDIKGNKLYFRLQGTSSGEPFTFGGFEILESSSEIIG